MDRLFSMLPEGAHSSNVKHFRGMPPELTGEDTRQEMGSPLVLVIEKMPDGVFLYRFDSKGECVGDTWHMNLDDAKEQASYEFEGVVLNWQEETQTIAEWASRLSGRTRTPGALHLLSRRNNEQ